METMPRPRWPHLLREVSRHGTVRWVFRVGHGPRKPISALYGTAEFEAAYHAAIRGEAVPAPRAGRADTLEWLWDRHRDSSAWAALSEATRRQRVNLMAPTIKSAGAMPYGEVGRGHVIKGREDRARTPSQANNWINAMRALFRWAKENGFVTSDPTEGVKIVKRPKTGGFREGTEDDIAKFEARWPVGTRERLALTIFLETGLRRGDAAALGRQHIRDEMIVIRTEKTGQQVRIPVSAALSAAIKATPSPGLALLSRADGQTMSKEGLGNWFHAACKAAKVGFSAHGLRKAAAARLTDLGLTEAELEQIMGWAPGSGMARVYTKRRDSAKLADRVAEKMRAEKGTVYSQPEPSVPNPATKTLK